MKALLLIFLIILALSVNGQEKSVNDNQFLYLIQDTTAYDRYAYINSTGDTIIQFDKYLMCYTDTLKTFGIVLKEDVGFVGIDKDENILFEIFPYDNGPDYFSNGVFRIIKDSKIGYADSSGKVIIEPQFECAYPFNNGFAKVTFNCQETKDGEYSSWKSNNWFFIDKSGLKISQEPVYNCPCYFDPQLKKVIYTQVDNMQIIDIQEFSKRLVTNIKIDTIPKPLDTKGIVSFIIDPDSTLLNIEILDPINPIIDKLIIDIIKTWDNRPIGYCEGNPVPVELKIPYNIELK